MKRMTLLTVLAMVFSLFTVTAAIAGPGPGAGGEQAGETGASRTATQVQARDGECQADDCQTGEMTHTQTQTQEKEQVGECQAGDDCPVGDQVKTQTRTQARTQAETQLKECQADDCQAEEALMKREQIRERLMNQILAMLGAENADVEGQYRLILNLMLQNTLGFRAMFI